MASAEQISALREVLGLGSQGGLNEQFALELMEALGYSMDPDELVYDIQAFQADLGVNETGRLSSQDIDAMIAKAQAGQLATASGTAVSQAILNAVGGTPAVAVAQGVDLGTGGFAEELAVEQGEELVAAQGAEAARDIAVSQSANWTNEKAAVEQWQRALQAKGFSIDFESRRTGRMVTGEDAVDGDRGAAVRRAEAEAGINVEGMSLQAALDALAQVPARGAQAGQQISATAAETLDPISALQRSIGVEATGRYSRSDGAALQQILATVDRGDGNTGIAVKCLQYVLDHHGFNNGGLDGKMGPNTFRGAADTAAKIGYDAMMAEAIALDIAMRQGTSPADFFAGRATATATQEQVGGEVDLSQIAIPDLPYNPAITVCDGTSYSRTGETDLLEAYTTRLADIMQPRSADWLNRDQELDRIDHLIERFRGNGPSTQGQVGVEVDLNGDPLPQSFKDTAIQNLMEYRAQVEQQDATFRALPGAGARITYYTSSAASLGENVLQAAQAVAEDPSINPEVRAVFQQTLAQFDGTNWHPTEFVRLLSANAQNGNVGDHRNIRDGVIHALGQHLQGPAATTHREVLADAQATGLLCQKEVEFDGGGENPTSPATPIGRDPGDPKSKTGRDSGPPKG